MQSRMHTELNMPSVKKIFEYLKASVQDKEGADSSADKFLSGMIC